MVKYWMIFRIFLLWTFKGTLEYRDWGAFLLNMENLSDWVINEVTITVQIYSEKDSSLLTTREITYDIYTIDPFSK